MTGLLVARTDDAVTLRDSEGKDVRIPSAEVETLKPDDTSLMPVGVVGHLSLGELADLLAFLGDQAEQSALGGK